MPTKSGMEDVCSRNLSANAFSVSEWIASMNPAGLMHVCCIQGAGKIEFEIQEETLKNIVPANVLELLFQSCVRGIFLNGCRDQLAENIRIDRLCELS